MLPQKKLQHSFREVAVVVDRMDAVVAEMTKMELVAAVRDRAVAPVATDTSDNKSDYPVVCAAG